MSSDKLKVDTVRLDADAKTVNDSILKLENAINKFEQAYHQLNLMWDGPASEVYLEVYNEDILDLKEIVAALKSFGNFELFAENRYNRCENEVDDIIRSI